MPQLVRLEPANEVTYLCRAMVEGGFYVVQAVKLVDGVPTEWVQIARKQAHAYTRCSRCDELASWVTPDGFCRDCL